MESLTQSLKTLSCRPSVPQGHTLRGATSGAVPTLWAILLLALGKSPNLLVLHFPICNLPVLRGLARAALGPGHCLY